jgi:hypothetical protein
MRRGPDAAVERQRVLPSEKRAHGGTAGPVGAARKNMAYAAEEILALTRVMAMRGADLSAEGAANGL